MGSKDFWVDVGWLGFFWAPCVSFESCAIYTLFMEDFLGPGQDNRGRPRGHYRVPRGKQLDHRLGDYLVSAVMYTEMPTMRRSYRSSSRTGRPVIYSDAAFKDLKKQELKQIAGHAGGAILDKCANASLTTLLMDNISQGPNAKISGSGFLPSLRVFSCLRTGKLEYRKKCNESNKGHPNKQHKCCTCHQFFLRKDLIVCEPYPLKKHPEHGHLCCNGRWDEKYYLCRCCLEVYHLDSFA